MVLSSRSMAPSPMTVTTSPTTGPLEDDFVPLPGTGDISRIIRHPEFRATGGWILLHPCTRLGPLDRDIRSH